MEHLVKGNVIRIIGLKTSGTSNGKPLSRVNFYRTGFTVHVYKPGSDLNKPVQLSTYGTGKDYIPDPNQQSLIQKLFGLGNDCITMQNIGQVAEGSCVDMVARIERRDYRQHGVGQMLSLTIWDGTLDQFNQTNAQPNTVEVHGWEDDNTIKFKNVPNGTWILFQSLLLNKFHATKEVKFCEGSSFVVLHHGDPRVDVAVRNYLNKINDLSGSKQKCTIVPPITDIDLVGVNISTIEDVLRYQKCPHYFVINVRLKEYYPEASRMWIQSFCQNCHLVLQSQDGVCTECASNEFVQWIYCLKIHVYDHTGELELYLSMDEARQFFGQMDTTPDEAHGSHKVANDLLKRLARCNVPFDLCVRSYQPEEKKGTGDVYYQVFATSLTLER
ncbi:hypothetical protein SAMD00019534_051480 [Acytostelium subglobosum LB1]|uniref:hypothetical protein n=1 Tax=Acytostelium subglobosum LB1 TaxID=1410327 RepID=UPI000645200D|nr:hypothetical protein SAMD00019534_051480 [Acytostelium subglobosum LB1]GAM21973.1 hypothetical protein SAMD00019534_051480 [Acytostelium subglobosum LB1]|eukprot:XP_012755073.1 hypothetical protein SAMD00019534_051480 [Acytostelium subglobosum LB1]